jgi:hypothetical protein
MASLNSSEDTSFTSSNIAGRHSPAAFCELDISPVTLLVTMTPRSSDAKSSFSLGVLALSQRQNLPKANLIKSPSSSRALAPDEKIKEVRS